MLMKKILLLLIYFSFYQFLFSENKNPIEITADAMEWDKEQGKAIAIGNAKAIRGDAVITAKKITAILDSTSNSQKISKLYAIGDVKFYKDDEEASGKEATYDIKEDKVIIKGNVVLQRQTNIMLGEKLIIDFKTGLSKLSGLNSKDKVKMKYNSNVQ